jgi:hypothetical protein
MKLNRLVIVAFVLAVVCTARFASAQSGVYYPGSAWTANGTLSPVEKGNVISLTHAEQGIALRGVEVFGQTTFSIDSKHFDWDRRFLNGGGIRFTQTVPHGMVRVSESFVRERRYNGDVTHQGFVFAAEAWFGWNHAPQPRSITK